MAAVVVQVAAADAAVVQVAVAVVAVLAQFLQFLQFPEPQLLLLPVAHLVQPKAADAAVAVQVADAGKPPPRARSLRQAV